MSWRANTFAENIEYGLDPHDDSDYLTISDNIFRENGNHGLICSVECNNLVIVNNRSYSNGKPAGSGGASAPKGNGIMLHRNVNGALIEGNTVYNNFQDGIAIFDSHEAVVRNNIVANNATSAIRLSVGSSGNLVESNTLSSSAAAPSGSGYLIYTYKGNDTPTSGGDGLPKNNTFRNNRLTSHKSPMMKIVAATANRFEGNTIDGPAGSVDFRSAVGNRLRDGEVGKAIQITLDMTSTATLEDSRGYVWMLSSGSLRSTAEPDGTTLGLTHANTGGSVSVTTLDLVVRPAHGAVAVQPAIWEPESKSWMESSSTTATTVAHAVGDLQPGTCYSVSANGTVIRRLIAGTSGRISFAYSDYGGPLHFVVAPASGCSVAAPAYQLLLPLVRR
jgi:parallel beta-helix repeat protein